MLLHAPIDGKVVEVLGSLKARVNFGYESGAWNGMSLWADCEGSPWVEAVAVHATNSVIESNHPATVFKIGDRVSSRQFERSNDESNRAKVSSDVRHDAP